MIKSNILTVSELSSEIKYLIENRLPYVQLEGEVSNYKNHYSGHAYFTLKDDKSQISAVIWKSNMERINFELEDGMKVVVSGRVTLYEKSGRYQITIDAMEKSGTGDLQRQFEKVKEELEKKGYFSKKQKKKLPLFPRIIGIVTSETGAALQDMISVAKRRNPSIQLVIRSAKVQGNGAAIDIAEGINEFNKFKEIDAIIIGRGGGSLEDLWAFNEKLVAEAIFNSIVPIVSAVGHEIDFSISDFVADERAATPSAAMEILIPDINEFFTQLDYYCERSQQLLIQRLRIMRDRLNVYQQHYAFRKPENIVQKKLDSLMDIKKQRKEIFEKLIAKKTQDIEIIQKQLVALSPLKVLERGYSIIEQNNNVLRSINDIKNEEISIQMRDGKITFPFS